MKKIGLVKSEEIIGLLMERGYIPSGLYRVRSCVLKLEADSFAEITVSYIPELPNVAEAESAPAVETETCSPHKVGELMRKAEAEREAVVGKPKRTHNMSSAARQAAADRMREIHRRRREENEKMFQEAGIK